MEAAARRRCGAGSGSEAGGPDPAAPSGQTAWRRSASEPSRLCWWDARGQRWAPGWPPSPSSWWHCGGAGALLRGPVSDPGRGESRGPERRPAGLVRRPAAAPRAAPGAADQGLPAADALAEVGSAVRGGRERSHGLLPDGVGEDPGLPAAGAAGAPRGQVGRPDGQGGGTRTLAKPPFGRVSRCGSLWAYVNVLERASEQSLAERPGGQRPWCGGARAYARACRPDRGGGRGTPRGCRPGREPLAPAGRSPYQAIRTLLEWHLVMTCNEVA